MPAQQKIDKRLLAQRSALAPDARVRVDIVLQRHTSPQEYQSLRRDLSQLGVRAEESRPFAGILVTDVPVGVLDQVADLSAVEWLGAPADDAPIQELLDPD